MALNTDTHNWPNGVTKSQNRPMRRDSCLSVCFVVVTFVFETGFLWVTALATQELALYPRLAANSQRSLWVLLVFVQRKQGGRTREKGPHFPAGGSYCIVISLLLTGEHKQWFEGMVQLQESEVPHLCLCAKTLSLGTASYLALGKTPFLCLPYSQRLRTFLDLWLHRSGLLSLSS